MICENDKLVIPEKYRKMSVSELRKEKELILEEFKKTPYYGLKKSGGEKGESMFLW